MSHRAEPLSRPDLPDYAYFAARLTALGDCAPRTAEAYAARARLAVDWFTVHKRGVPLLELTAGDIEDYIIALDRQGLSTSSRRLAVYALRKLYHHLGRNLAGFDNPAAGVHAPTQKSVRPEPYTALELHRLLTVALQAAMAHPHGSARWLRAYFDYAVLATFRYTGLRLSELIDLETDHIRLDARRLEVRKGKGTKQRFVRIPKPLADILTVYLRDVRPHCPPSPRMFANPDGYDGTAVYGQLAMRAAADIVAKYARAAGLHGHASPHNLRHSWATDLFRRKAPLNAIQRLAGHESLLTTIRYIGLPLDHLDELVDEAFDDGSLPEGDDPEPGDDEQAA